MLGNNNTGGARKKNSSIAISSKGHVEKMSVDSTRRPGRIGSPQSDCKSAQDTQMDSGFMSGSNLLSSSSFVSEDLGIGMKEAADLSTSSKSQSEEVNTSHSAKTFQSDNLDSGIDLSERISSLNLSSPTPQTSTNISSSHQEEISPEDSDRNIPPLREPRSRLAQLGLSPVHITILKEIFKKDNDGDTQLHIAVIRGFIEVVWHITRLLPHQALLDIPNHTGRTALHLAVASGDACLARHLIVCGASPVAKNRKGETPLHIACRSGDHTMVSSLTNQVTAYEVVTARLLYPPTHTPGLLAADLNNYDGQTCIHIAAQNGHKEILQHLTWFGADINAKEGKCGRTALHFAVEARDKDLLKFLVDCCKAALSITNYAGLTPYQLAVVNDAPDIANFLEDLGAKKDPLPSSFSADEDLDYDDEPTNFESEEGSPWAMDDLRIGGVSQVPFQYVNPIPVSSHSPFDADQFL